MATVKSNDGSRAKHEAIFKLLEWLFWLQAEWKR